MEKQCAEAARKGFKVLGMIARNFVTRRRVVILQLYKSLVRPLLDYCVQAWRPYRKKDIDLLERECRRELPEWWRNVKDWIMRRG